MATFKRFEDIEAWQTARELSRDIYKVSNQGAFSKDYALRDQIRRACISIMSNIAEGFERDGNKEFLQFLSNATASSGEVASQLYVALDQEYVEPDVFQDLYALTRRTGRMIAGLMRYLRVSQIKGLKYKKTTESAR